MSLLSLRRRLLIFLYACLLLVWLGLLHIALRNVQEQSRRAAESGLEQSAVILLQTDLAHLRTPPLELPDYRSGGLSYQIWDARGHNLLQSAEAPDYPYNPAENHLAFQQNDQHWLSYARWDARHEYQVRVFEVARSAQNLLVQMSSGIALTLIVALVLLSLLVWLAVVRSLQPLYRLMRAVRFRDDDSAYPLESVAMPLELQPLVAAFNQTLAKLNASIARERSFTADAAHELRTPLAAIKIQAEALLSAKNEQQRSTAILQMITSVERVTHLSQQMLLLARLECLDQTSRQLINLSDLVIDSLSRAANQAKQKQIRFDVFAETECLLEGEPSIISILMDNLLDNAVKFGREGGRIALNLSRHEQQICLRIQDDGSGVPEHERDRLADRFYRTVGSTIPGSGLGLSIVHAIAKLHRATLEFGDGLDGQGLGVAVIFPVSVRRDF